MRERPAPIAYQVPGPKASSPTSAMQFGFDNTGSHYGEDNNLFDPSVMTAESLHSSRRMGVYVDYEVGSETYVRLTGAWVKADSVLVRRLGAWVDVGPYVYAARRRPTTLAQRTSRSRPSHAQPRASA